MDEFQTTNEGHQKPRISELRGEAFAYIWETIKIIVISLIIIIPVRYFIVQPFFVKGASMKPVFENNDYILIDEISYRFREPKRGEVIVFRAPEDTSEFFIKRIIGLPGETVRIKNNTVTVTNKEDPDGLTLDEPYLSSRQETLGDIRVTLGKDKYYVLGDNRLESSDSRKWGTLDNSLITGKVLIRIWPFSKFQKFETPTY